MPPIAKRKARAKWSTKLDRKTISRVGVLSRSPKPYDTEGFLTESAAKELEKIANKILRVSPGRKVDGLRSETPSSEILCADVFEFIHADKQRRRGQNFFDYYEGNWDLLEAVPIPS